MTERLKAANDNDPLDERLKKKLREEGLRQERKHDLLECGSEVNRVRDWIKQKLDDTTTSESNASEVPIVRQKEILSALEDLAAVLAETDKAIDAAEQQPDSLEAFGRGKASAYRLAIALEGAKRVIDEE